jgi:hypothetical protein
MKGQSGGSVGVDDKYAARSMTGFGAIVMGRNMFGPIRGAWLDHSWKGWWGENPPFQTPTFVLTRHPQDSIVMDGGTIFHFVTGGIQDALEQAKTVADEKDIQIGGGVGTIRQYLRAGRSTSCASRLRRLCLVGAKRCLLALIFRGWVFALPSMTWARWQCMSFWSVNSVANLAIGREEQGCAGHHLRHQELRHHEEGARLARQT